MEKLHLTMEQTCMTVAPPSRRMGALAALAGQLVPILTELLVGDAYRCGLSPHLCRDLGGAS